MKNFFTMLFLLLFANISALNALEKLTLDEAIEIIKSTNLEIKVATYEVEAAKEEADAVSGNHWGKLDFIQEFSKSDNPLNVFGFKLTSREATFNDFGFSDFGRITNDTPPKDLNYPESRNFFQTKLKYELPIFTGFKISSYSDIMKSMVKIKNLNKMQVINEKLYEIRKSFYDMSLLYDSERNLKIVLENIKTLETMTKSMIEVGYAKNVDLLEVQAKKGNVERVISQIKSNQKLLYHYISFLLNKKVTSIDVPFTSLEVPNFTNDEIINSNLDIKKAHNGLKVTESMVDVSDSALYPMIGAFAEVSTADDEFLNDTSKHDAYTVGARLTWNIFSGGVDKANMEKSRLNLLKAQSQVKLATSGIELQIEKVKTEIETLGYEIKLLEQELKLADEIYKNYEGRYKEKLTSMSDVIIKQSEQIQKILQLQQVKNKRNERIFALEKLANGDLQ